MSEGVLEALLKGIPEEALAKILVRIFERNPWNNVVKSNGKNQDMREMPENTLGLFLEKNLGEALKEFRVKP